MLTLPIYQVDAFAERPFCGNPAAVCPLPEWLDDATLQAIAAENNLSETAFYVREGAHHRLRWFTPTLEVDLCGHATLAAASVLLESDGEAVFETRSGRLTATRRGPLLTMDFPVIPFFTTPPPAEMLTCLGSPVEAFFGITSIHGAKYYMAVFSSADQVATLQPDTAQMGRELNANVIATAPGVDGADFVSRFFGPASGVPEDPVTGSAHCTLAPYWAQRLRKTRLLGRQISRRGGEVGCEVVGDRVRLTGQCVRYLEGTIRVPAVDGR